MANTLKCEGLVKAIKTLTLPNSLINCKLQIAKIIEKIETFDVSKTLTGDLLSSYTQQTLITHL